MANKKISELDLGNGLLSTDKILVARGGTNVSVSGHDILGLVPPAGLSYISISTNEYRYYRIGLASVRANYTWMYNVDLRTPNGVIPTFVAQQGEFPIAWIDGNTTTEAYILSGEKFQYNTFDYGIPVLLTKLTTVSGSNPAFATNYTVSASNNGVDFTPLTSGTFWHTSDFKDNPNAGFGTPGVPNQFQAATFNVPGFIGGIGYNLSADPAQNIGKVLKVNAAGTGFDFTEVGAGPKGDKGDKGDTGPQGPAGPVGSGGGGTGAKVKIYQNTNTISSIGPGEVEAYSITFTPRAGSTLDINLGGIQPVVISTPTAPGSGYSQIETKVYRNGVLLTNQTSMETNTGLPSNGNFTEEDSSTDPITFRVTKQYAIYNGQKVFQNYDTRTGTFTYSYKIIDYP